MSYPVTTGVVPGDVVGQGTESVRGALGHTGKSDTISCRTDCPT